MIDAFAAAFEKTETLRRHPWAGYVLAAVGIGLAAWLRFAIADTLVGFPFITFFPVVMLVTFFCGVGPGLFAAALGGLAAWYWWLPPWASFALVWPSTPVALLFYVLVTGVDIVLVGQMERYVRRIREERAAAEWLRQERDLLFRELQHRVANNMASVSAMLAAHRRRFEPGSAAAEAFGEAIERIAGLAAAHRRMHDPESAERPLGPYLRQLCEDLVANAGRSDVSVEVEADPVPLPLTSRMSLALLCAELVTNALKHAFPPGRGGVIRVALRAEPEGGYRFEVCDDGVGFDPDAAPKDGRLRLGRLIIEDLARQLGGALAWKRGPGACAVLTVQAAA